MPQLPSVMREGSPEPLQACTCPICVSKDSESFAAVEAMRKLVQLCGMLVSASAYSAPVLGLDLPREVRGYV